MTYSDISVASLAGSGELKIDVNITNQNGVAKNSDKITVSGVENTPAINLNSIQMSGEIDNGNYENYVTVIDGNAKDSVNFTVNGSATSQLTIGKTDGAGNGKYYNLLRTNTTQEGKLDLLVGNLSCTLYHYITEEGKTTEEKTLIESLTEYVISEDRTYLNYGTTQRSDSASKSLSIRMNNGVYIIGTFTNNIAVDSGYTLNITGTVVGSKTSTIRNTNTTSTPSALMNKGTINIDGTLTLANAYTDTATSVLNVNTSATLNLNAASTINGTVTHAGNLNINENTGIAEFMQTAGITSIADNTTLTLTGASTISGGSVDNIGTLSIAANGILTINTEAQNIGSMVTNAGTLNIHAGTILNKFKQTAGTTNIANEKILTVSNAEFSNASTVSGTGKIYAVTANLAENADLYFKNSVAFEAMNVNIEAGSYIYVGSAEDTKGSSFKVKYLNLAGTSSLIVDPAGALSMALIENINTGTRDSAYINLNKGNLLAGQNSVLVLGAGTMPNMPAVEGVTAALYLQKNLTVGGKSVVIVDGGMNEDQLSTAGSNAAPGSVTFGSNSLLNAPVSLLGTYDGGNALIKANSVSVGSNSKLYLTNIINPNGYVVAKANFVTVDPTAWNGSNLIITGTSLYGNLQVVPLWALKHKRVISVRV